MRLTNITIKMPLSGNCLFIKFGDKMNDIWMMKIFWRPLANNMRRIAARV